MRILCYATPVACIVKKIFVLHISKDYSLVISIQTFDVPLYANLKTCACLQHL